MHFFAYAHVGHAFGEHCSQGTQIGAAALPECTLKAVPLHFLDTHVGHAYGEHCSQDTQSSLPSQVCVAQRRNF